MTPLNAEDPAAASRFSASSKSQSYLRRFPAAPPAQRQRMAGMIASVLRSQQYSGLLQQVFSTCNNY
jgi:hemophore-related protein